MNFKQTTDPETTYEAVMTHDNQQMVDHLEYHVEADTGLDSTYFYIDWIDSNKLPNTNDYAQ